VRTAYGRRLPVRLVDGDGRAADAEESRCGQARASANGKEQVRTRCGRPANSNRAASGDGVPPPRPRVPASAFSFPLPLPLPLSVNLPSPAVNASEQEFYRAGRSIPADFLSGANAGSISRQRPHAVLDSPPDSRLASAGGL
jgi:hypothetical protein